MEYFENEKDVIVLNDGEELDLNKTEKDKFYVHIKSIQQYFTSKDIKKRMTVFDQNNNISMFYFDVPFSKGSQNSIESFYMKRTIFISPHPMPYIIKRVEIPEENIVKEMFTPIEYWTQNIKKQVDSIEEDIIRNDPIGLQPKLQGSLVVQVNEGPKKIAEVFLSEGEDNKEKQKLRKVFRKFLETNAKAVKLHAQFVATHPVYAVLQEEVESGLNTLTSTLQPYLNE